MLYAYSSIEPSIPAKTLHKVYQPSRLCAKNILFPISNYQNKCKQTAYKCKQAVDKCKSIVDKYKQKAQTSEQIADTCKQTAEICKQFTNFGLDEGWTWGQKDWILHKTLGL